MVSWVKLSEIDSYIQYNIVVNVLLILRMEYDFKFLSQKMTHFDDNSSQYFF